MRHRGVRYRTAGCCGRRGGCPGGGRGSRAAAAGVVERIVFDDDMRAGVGEHDFRVVVFRYQYETIS